MKNIPNSSRNLSKQPKKLFKDMTSAEKRTNIAKDVIKQVLLGKLIATRGTYFEMRGLNRNFGDDHFTFKKKNIDEKEQINKLMPSTKCEVCAMGALFAVDVLKRNHFAVVQLGNSIGDGEISKRLNRIFGKNQLDLIETAFERHVVATRNHTLWDKYHSSSCYDYADASSDIREGRTVIAQKAVSFGDKYSTNEGRMIAIMKNIIKNGGNFLP